MEMETALAARFNQVHMYNAEDSVLQLKEKDSYILRRQTGNK